MRIKRIVNEKIFKEDYDMITEILLNEVVAYEDVIAAFGKVVDSEIFVF